MYYYFLVAGENPWLNETTICTYPEPWKTPAFYHNEDKSQIKKKNKKNNEAYVGEYYHKGFGEFKIYNNNNTLMYQMGLFLKGHLEPTHYPSKLKMNLSYPLDLQTWVPSSQLTITFQNGVTKEGTYKYTRVTIPYLEPTLPPTFIRGGGMETMAPPTPVRGEGIKCYQHFWKTLFSCFLAMNRISLYFRLL